MIHHGGGAPGGVIQQAAMAVHSGVADYVLVIAHLMKDRGIASVEEYKGDIRVQKPLMSASVGVLRSVYLLLPPG